MSPQNHYQKLVIIVFKITSMTTGATMVTSYERKRSSTIDKNRKIDLEAIFEKLIITFLYSLKVYYTFTVDSNVVFTR